MKKSFLKLAGLVLAAALVLGMSGCSSDSHEHTFAAEWTTSETHHWHAATCEHTAEVKDKAEHTFGEWTVNNNATWKDVTKKRKCNICGYEDTVTDVGSRTDMFCENPYDAETNEIATSSSKYIYFGVFPKTVLPQGCTVTVDKTDSVTMGANTYYKGSDGNYYAKVEENCCDSSGYTYTDTTTVKQSRAFSYRYFKVEPIKWKVLTTNYNNTGKALLLAEDMLTANVPYYVSLSSRIIDSKTVYANNYKYSTIRAYLNGKYESDDTQDKIVCNGKGFLQTAFTATAQSKIAETEVDNRKETTGYSESTYTATYACENTTDKIFLLSENEVVNSDYGFAAYNSVDSIFYGQTNAGIRVTTDYAKANYAYQSTYDGCGGLWWLRSPHYSIDCYARYVGIVGIANSGNRVDYGGSGVVPALCISLQ